MRNTVDVTGGKPIAVCRPLILDVSGVNPPFMTSMEGAVLLFCPGHHTHIHETIDLVLIDQ
jgi:hypothetical protein